MPAVILNTWAVAPSVGKEYCPEEVKEKYRARKAFERNQNFSFNIYKTDVFFFFLIKCMKYVPQHIKSGIL